MLRYIPQLKKEEFLKEERGDLVQLLERLIPILLLKMMEDLKT